MINWNTRGIMRSSKFSGPTFVIISRINSMKVTTRNERPSIALGAGKVLYYFK
jgi:hypothetical protein